MQAADAAASTAAADFAAEQQAQQAQQQVQGIHMAPQQQQQQQIAEQTQQQPQELQQQQQPVLQDSSQASRQQQEQQQHLQQPAPAGEATTQQQPAAADSMQQQLLTTPAAAVQNAQTPGTPGAPVDSQATAAVPASKQQQQHTPPPSPVRRLLNLAELSDGASVLAANPEAKRPERAIDKDIDSFMKNDCNAHKWMIIELSQVSCCGTGRLCSSRRHGDSWQMYRLHGHGLHLCVCSVRHQGLRTNVRWGGRWPQDHMHAAGTFSKRCYRATF
jgi:hypothetical protein